MKLTESQLEIINAPLNSKLFLSGLAGCGKTTTAIERLKALLAADKPADNILILTPQRTLQAPYAAILHNPDLRAGGTFTLATIGGLARRMVDLFWPLVADTAGFAHPDQSPIFLTLETVQYFMSRIVRPLLEQGFFESVTINRNRLYNQIIDNLNKSALVGFPFSEIGSRLDLAWYGDSAQRRIYRDAQESATRFRQYCLEHNLLDFSLQVEIFWKILWHLPECHNYLTRQYRHLIYDNVEEDVPIAHDLICEWLPDFDSALIIFDKDGGYRRFLGADPESSLRLHDLCDTHAELSESFITSPEIQYLETAFASTLLNVPSNIPSSHSFSLDALAFTEKPIRYFPQMLDWVTQEIKDLLAPSKIQPSEIVVLAPYLSDALRFSLTNRFDENGIPWRSHRPSRSLRDEPASHCLLTLTELAHPNWGIQPTKFDVAYALLYTIQGMDLIRAQLLAEIIYRVRDFTLSPFDQIKTDVQDRITYAFGNRYSVIRDWLMAYQKENPQPLDHFLRRLFGEILSQKGFGFHQNFDAVRVAASLIESVQKFRQVMESTFQDQIELGREYITMLQEGVIASQYLDAWIPESDNAVLIAPAYTFLMMNRPATVQFWLDVGSSGWWERIFQPLTQPYVLSRVWTQRDPETGLGHVWSDADEVKANQETLTRLVIGLLRRCRKKIYIGISDLGESGFEQRGPLLKAIWKMQMQAQKYDTNPE